VNVPLWAAVAAILLAMLAARADVRTRKIPNHLTFPAMLLALGTHLALGGVQGFVSSLAGLALAGGVLVPGWLWRWMGAGDVKLMAAAGAWLALPQAVIAVLASLVAGGAIALVLAAKKRVLLTTLRGAALAGAWSLARAPGGALPGSGVRFPFALAVLAGCIAALWIRP
jgi:prepilin peptidase CpaA